MKMIIKNDCLNGLLNETTATKCPFLEFITATLAVILINVKNEMFSVNQSLYDAYAEMIETDCSENENTCTYQKSLRTQNCLFDRKASVLSDEVLVRVLTNQLIK